MKKFLLFMIVPFHNEEKLLAEQILYYKYVKNVIKKYADTFLGNFRKEGSTIWRVRSMKIAYPTSF